MDGPDQDYLELHEVAAYLRMGVKTLRRLVQAGDFPHPVELSPGVRVWSWRDVLYWTLGAELRPRLRAARRKKPASPPQPSEGLGGTTPAHGGPTGKRGRPDA